MNESLTEPGAAPVAGEAWPPGPKPPAEGWTPRKFYWALAMVLALHVALIFLFGTKKPIVPRPVGAVPHLGLANSGNEFIALGNPILFALPNREDLVSEFWRQMPAIRQPDFHWTETPRYLPPDPVTLGSTFRQFMRTNHLTELSLEYKPDPKPTVPSIPFDDTTPQVTTMQIWGELAQRRLLSAVSLPTLARGDVLEPSTVQAVVATDGTVASEVVLDPTADADADQLALKLTRGLRFAPAPNVAVGQITFDWHTVPTNNVPAGNRGGGLP
jgi:hypothetical protein